MKIAVLSDIHANLQALQAVLADCTEQGVGEYWLLGDYVDYGANPIECIELLSRLPVKYAIGGNHDIGHYDGSKPITYLGNSDAAVFTKRIIERYPEKFAWLEEVAAKPLIFVDEIQAILVHGTIQDPYWGRFSFGVSDGNTFRDMEIQGIWLMLCGHSHESDRITRFERTIVNPGSVGQPRNGIPRAQYAIMEGRNIFLRQVDYDIDSAAKAVREAGLPEHLCKRLYTA